MIEKLYRTVTIKAKFSDEEKLYWQQQCSHANSLINCTLYQIKQKHFSFLGKQENAFTTYWKGDELLSGWKTYRAKASYSEICSTLKSNEHYRQMAAQAAQQSIKSVVESITSYNGLVKKYYSGEVDRPNLPRYRTKGGLACVTFPDQLLKYKEGFIFPPVSREIKPELITEVKLALPDFIDSDWVKEVTVRPCLGEFWIDWVIDDGKQPIFVNSNLDYTQAWGFDHGGANWLTGVSTKGQSLIINGKLLRSMNQGYSRLVAKYKQGRQNYWDSNLDRVQRKRNNQMRDAVNKAARFIVNRCLADGIGNLVIGWNQGMKNGSSMSKRNNQNFTPIPTGRLITRLKQLCPEYGIVLSVTEEANTSAASFLDGDSLPRHGEKPVRWRVSGKRVQRGLYRSESGFLINADCNGAANIIRKVATQLNINLAEVGSGSLALPQRYEVITDLSKSYRKQALRSASSDCVATSA